MRTIWRRSFHSHVRLGRAASLEARANSRLERSAGAQAGEVGGSAASRSANVAEETGEGTGRGLFGGANAN